MCPISGNVAYSRISRPQFYTQVTLKRPTALNVFLGIHVPLGPDRPEIFEVRWSLSRPRCIKNSKVTSGPTSGEKRVIDESRIVSE